jgi:hypothetical protein
MRIQQNSIIHEITLYCPSSVNSSDLQDDISDSSVRLENSVVHDVESMKQPKQLEPRFEQFCVW